MRPSLREPESDLHSLFRAAPASVAPRRFCAAPGPAPRAPDPVEAEPPEGRGMLRLAPALAAAFALLAGPAFAAAALGASGLSSPERLAGFEGASRDPGAAVIGLAEAGVRFSRALTLSPQQADHVAGMSGAALGSQGDQHWNGRFSIHFADAVEAAAFAFATPGAWTTAEALLDGKVVERTTWFATWDETDTAYVGFSGILFDEIRLTTDAALVLLDNLQWGVAAPSHAPLGGAAAAEAAAPGGEGISALLRGDAAAGAPAAITRANAPAAATAVRLEPAPEVPLPPAMALLSAALAGLGLMRLRAGRT